MSAAAAIQILDELAAELHDELYAPESDEAGSTPQTDVEMLCTVLAAIRNTRGELEALYRTVEADVLALKPGRRFVVQGLGECEVRRNTKRTGWDNEGLTRVLVARALDERVLDEKSGEYEPAHEAVARVLAECSRPSWRVTPLRDRGIQVDEFCAVQDDGWSLMLPKAKAT